MNVGPSSDHCVRLLELGIGVYFDIFCHSSSGMTNIRRAGRRLTRMFYVSSRSLPLAVADANPSPRPEPNFECWS